MHHKHMNCTYAVHFKLISYFAFTLNYFEQTLKVAWGHW